MSKQKTDPKLEQALTRGDLAMRQINSARATALLRALGEMIVAASATIGVEAVVDVPNGDKVYDPEDGVWPQALVLSFDGPIDEAEEEELRTVQLIADKHPETFQVVWHRADGKMGRHEARPLAMVAFLTDVEVPWLDDDA